jgi:hypothetical protein
MISKLSDEPRPRYDPAGAAALAQLRWDFDVWCYEGCPAYDPAGNLLTFDDEVTVSEMRAYFFDDLSFFTTPQ